ncbi:MAG: hypothetical protein WDW36_007763, partial [Sanguina aurantia]
GTLPDNDTIKRLIRKGTCERLFVPMVCGTAFKNKGVQPLLDAVVDYLPSPLEVGDVQGVDQHDAEISLTRESSDGAPFSALAFKIMTDPFVGSLTFCRIYSGVLEAGTYALNSNKGKKERIGRLMMMHANNREDIKMAFAGDIVAIGGLKDMITGETLCDEKNPIVLEKMDFPDPMSTALYKMVKADPSLRMEVDKETGQTVLKGMGELHLEITLDRMRTELGVEANMGKPKVSFREAFGKSVEHTYTHKKQSGGSGQFPLEKEHAALRKFPPPQNTPQVLVDGSYHDVDSSALAFQIAARGAFREAMQRCGAKLLEPIMKVEVITPEDHMGDVIGDLNSRRGLVNGFIDKPASMKQIQASVPLSEMFSYVSTLRGMTKGRAQYSMQLQEYQVVPPNIQTEIIAKHKSA